MSDAASKIVKPLVALLIFGLLLGILGPISLDFMANGADQISTWASGYIDDNSINSSDARYFLLSMLANDAIVFILFMAAFVLVVVGLALGLIYLAVKGISGK